MLAKASVFTAALAGVAHAQDYWFVPPGLTDFFCDGISRPDWDECEAHYVDDFLSTEMRIGPDFLDGQTFTYENCQVRYIQCSNSGYEWTMDGELGMFALARNACARLGGGGVQRQGDLCVVVEDPNNPYRPRRRREVETRGEFIDQPAWPASGATTSEKPEPSVEERSHPKDIHMAVARDLVKESEALERRQDCEGGGTCYIYSQGGFAANIRGPQTRVCNNILPDGASCGETTSVTVTESYTAGVEVSTGLKDVMDIGASFSTTYSEAIQTSLTTTITIDCPGGSGYIVWYPLMEISFGECGEGTCNGGFCQNTNRYQCEVQKPMVPSEGTLSGEYDFVCI